MKSRSRSKITAPLSILAFLLPFVLFSCGGGGSGGSASDPQGNTPPTVLGGYSPVSGTANVIPFHFTLIPSDPDGDPVELRIDFDGDGVWDTSYSSSTSYDHIFPVAGTYATKVQARDSLGAESSVVNLPPLVVNDPTTANTPPFISGTVNPTTGETGATQFSFGTTPSDPDGDAVQVRVDYEGDGSWDTAYASQTAFNHIFLTAGTYTGRMQARDGLGAESAVVNFPAVTVNDPSPTNQSPSIAGTVSPSSGERGVTSFHYVLTPSDPDGDSTAVRIDYEGDGAWDTGYGSQIQFDKVFAQSGTYTGKIQARDSLGAESGVQNLSTITVNDPAPTNHPPNITGSVSPSTGETGTTQFSYTTTPSDQDGDSVQVRVDYDGNGTWDTAFGGQRSFAHTFSSAGTYTGKMQARDSKGAESNVVNFPSVTVNDPAPANHPPAVATLAATSVGRNSAVLNGNVNPNGLETNAWFEWGTSQTLSAFSSTSGQSLGSGTTSQPVSAALSGLSPGTTYYFRVAASNSSGTTKGSIANFGSTAISPAVTTNPATSITTTGATLNGIVNPNGAATTAWFQYGTDPSFLSFAETAQQAMGPGTTGQAVSSTLTTLAPWRTYYFRVVASNDGGTQTGTMDSFPTGEYYVAIGDSITRGSHDDFPDDDISLDGRNTGGGYEPILNDLLTMEKGYPHTVVNGGISGDTSADGTVQIATTLSNHPLAKYYLVMYGTNDSWFPAVPSGLGLHPGDPGYSGSYKDNMQRILSAILAAGKTPYLAKVPYASDPGIDLLAIQNYNLVIEELVFDNDIWVIPPDFYAHFQAPLYMGELDDGIHPNGFGYQSMADLWFDALTAGWDILQE